MLEPRAAVRKMAPYSPPSAGREGKLRLDFNENTVGCSPAVIEFLREHLFDLQKMSAGDCGAARRGAADLNRDRLGPRGCR